MDKYLHLNWVPLPLIFWSYKHSLEKHTAAWRMCTSTSVPSKALSVNWKLRQCNPISRKKWWQCMLVQTTDMLGRLAWPDCRPRHWLLLLNSSFTAAIIATDARGAAKQETWIWVIIRGFCCRPLIHMVIVLVCPYTLFIYKLPEHVKSCETVFHQI